MKALLGCEWMRRVKEVRMLECITGQQEGKEDGVG